MSLQVDQALAECRRLHPAGKGRPKPVDRGALIGMDLLMLVVAVLILLAAAKVGSHRVQQSFDQRCRHGIATACALDGRPSR